MKKKMVSNSILKNSCQLCDLLTEQIIQAHCTSIKMYLQFCIKYKQIANQINSEELKRYFSRIDRYYFDDAGKIKWITLIPLIPPNIEENLKKEYDMLNENEIRLCCLILFDVSTKYITEILPFTRNSVHAVASRIRKKTGMKDIREGMKNLLLKKIATNNFSNDSFPNNYK